MPRYPNYQSYLVKCGVQKKTILSLKHRFPEDKQRESDPPIKTMMILCFWQKQESRLSLSLNSSSITLAKQHSLCRELYHWTDTSSLCVTVRQSALCVVLVARPLSIVFMAPLGTSSPDAIVSVLLRRPCIYSSIYLISYLVILSAIDPLLRSKNCFKIFLGRNLSHSDIVYIDWIDIVSFWHSKGI